MVWCRDGGETALALAVAGYPDEAATTFGYLISQQNPADGSWPRCFFITGTNTRMPGAVQLDEVAFPLLLAGKLAEMGVTLPVGTDDAVRLAAGYLAANGPVSNQDVDRWEENAGASAFTIGLEIVALLVAASRLTGSGPGARPRAGGQLERTPRGVHLRRRGRAGPGLRHRRALRPDRAGRRRPGHAGQPAAGLPARRRRGAGGHGVRLPAAARPARPERQAGHRHARRRRGDDRRPTPPAGAPTTATTSTATANGWTAAAGRCAGSASAGPGRCWPANAATTTSCPAGTRAPSCRRCSPCAAAAACCPSRSGTLTPCPGSTCARASPPAARCRWPGRTAS